MKIWSNNIIDGWLDEEFGGNSKNAANFNHSTNIKSFHLGWKDLPKNTKSLVLIFQDYDAIPVCGFSWIHWTAANIDPNMNELSVNASLEKSKEFIQGKNSWASKLLGEGQYVFNGYGGCAPPDKDHQYQIEVFAIDKTLEIDNGFYMNELIKKMENHIIESDILKFWYKKIN